jgi:hypothetical protein
MSINVWFDKNKNEYRIMNNGRIYVRKDFIPAKELIDGFVKDLAEQATKSAA